MAGDLEGETAHRAPSGRATGVSARSIQRSHRLVCNPRSFSRARMMLDPQIPVPVLEPRISDPASLKPSRCRLKPRKGCRDLCGTHRGASLGPGVGEPMQPCAPNRLAQRSEYVPEVYPILRRGLSNLRTMMGYPKLRRSVRRPKKKNFAASLIAHGRLPRPVPSSNPSE